MKILEGVHVDWVDALQNVMQEIKRIENLLKGQTFNPAIKNVFRALRTPPSMVSVVIFGQDPYPTPSHAMGLAFSVPSSIKPIPRTLSNIFQELGDDLGCNVPSSGDLTPWANQGVALVNRILTVPQGRSAGHAHLNWQVVTNEIARVLGEEKCVAVLWGKYAQELSGNFRQELTIASAHPSPLSAYRGFFGSKPFSRTNQLLAGQSRRAIDWTLT